MPTTAALTRPTDLPMEWLMPARTSIASCPRGRLVIWDLGTIPSPWRAVDASAHVAACAEVLGRYPVLVVDVDARPDPLVALDMLVANGIPSDQAPLLLPRYLPALHRAFHRGWNEAGADGLAWQGNRLWEVMSGAAAVPGVVQSFIAPELRGILWRKLADTGLDRYLDRESGACGSDHVRRSDLIDIAVRRAARRNDRRFTAHDVLVFPPGHWLWAQEPITPWPTPGKPMRVVPSGPDVAYWERKTSVSEPDAEDRKIIMLARSARARADAPEAAAVRDTDGRTYVGVTVALSALRLSALQVAVATAVSSGATGLEAAAVVTAAESLPVGSVAVVRELGPNAPVFHADATGAIVAVHNGLDHAR